MLHITQELEEKLRKAIDSGRGDHESYDSATNETEIVDTFDTDQALAAVLEVLKEHGAEDLWREDMGDVD
jgi:hypothetical protein